MRAHRREINYYALAAKLVILIIILKKTIKNLINILNLSIQQKVGKTKKLRNANVYKTQRFRKA